MKLLTFITTFSTYQINKGRYNAEPSASYPGVYNTNYDPRKHNQPSRVMVDICSDEKTGPRLGESCAYLVYDCNKTVFANDIKDPSLCRYKISVEEAIKNQERDL